MTTLLQEKWFGVLDEWRAWLSVKVNCDESELYAVLQEGEKKLEELKEKYHV